MSMGQNVAKIAAAAREAGAPAPRAILDAPILEDPYHRRVLDAFWTLSTCRGIGQGSLGPIPWHSADHYAHRFGFASDQIEYDSFLYLIQKLDEEFLNRQRADLEQELRRGKSQDFRGTHKSATRRHSPKRR